jgi:hypothetical protein
MPAYHPVSDGLSSALVLALDVVLFGPVDSWVCELVCVMLERSADGCAAGFAAGVAVAGLSAVTAAGLGEAVAGEATRAAEPEVGRGAPVGCRGAAAPAVGLGVVVGSPLAAGLGAVAVGSPAEVASFAAAVVGSDPPRGLLAPAAGNPVPAGLGAVVAGLGAAVGSPLPAGLGAANELTAGLGATGAAAVAGGMDESMLAEAGSASSPALTASPRTSMMCSHFLHLNFVTSRPRSFSSATWYFCLQFSQRKFIATSGTRAWEGLVDGHPSPSLSGDEHRR